MKYITLLILSLVFPNIHAQTYMGVVKSNGSIDAYETSVIDSIYFTYFVCGETIMDYDSNIYSTVEIGGQCWLQENLRVTHHPNGTAIPLKTSDYSWAALSDNNTDDAYYLTGMGALYTWSAAMGDNAVSSITNPSGVQGVCPDGWHIPSQSEWMEMINYAGNPAGGKLKKTGTSCWLSPNTGATNSSGFTGCGGGSRDYDNGDYFYAKDYGNWWTSTEYSSTQALFIELYSNSDATGEGHKEKSSGYSVRCIKD